ncbi:hypothetical protein [Luteimonas sp. MHLX1A]|uniref:hypothetical protein n=1 Tax=Alterluteimonas muca TaxID=2878684 RepID=UPI001E63E48F|nr:hypothetical protein [Luteimonas sp. MHLX1A]MCD9046854.1 hypothetical protein [Luteimonas sp. MHLX1A]
MTILHAYIFGAVLLVGLAYQIYITFFRPARRHEFSDRFDRLDKRLKESEEWLEEVGRLHDAAHAKFMADMRKPIVRRGRAQGMPVDIDIFSQAEPDALSTVRPVEDVDAETSTCFDEPERSRDPAFEVDEEGLFMTGPYWGSESSR